MAAELLTRARAHLGALDELRQRGGEALGEAAHYQRMGRSWIGFAGAIGLNVAMVGGAWLWYFAREALAGVTGQLLANVVMVPLAIIGVIAVMVGWAGFLTYRKKKRAEFTAVEVGVVSCDHCGATVPVALGREPAAPSARPSWYPGKGLPCGPRPPPSNRCSRWSCRPSTSATPTRRR